MSHYQLNATTRTHLGHDVRKLRKEGFLPIVAYSNKVESISLQVSHRDFIKAFKAVGTTGVVELIIDQNKSTLPCILHNFHIHPVTSKLQHADLIVVDLKIKITAEVPLEFIGESPAIKETGGILETQHKSLKVEALPDSLPSVIKVDISTMKIHSDVIKVSDLGVSPMYSISEENSLIIASIVSETAEDEVEKSSDKTVIE